MKIFIAIVGLLLPAQGFSQPGDTDQSPQQVIRPGQYTDQERQLAIERFTDYLRRRDEHDHSDEIQRILTAIEHMDNPRRQDRLLDYFVEMQRLGSQIGEARRAGDMDKVKEHRQLMNQYFSTLRREGYGRIANMIL